MVNYRLLAARRVNHPRHSPALPGRPAVLGRAPDLVPLLSRAAGRPDGAADQHVVPAAPADLLLPLAGHARTHPRVARPLRQRPGGQRHRYGTGGKRHWHRHGDTDRALVQAQRHDTGTDTKARRHVQSAGTGTKGRQHWYIHKGTATLTERWYRHKGTTLVQTQRHAVTGTDNDRHNDVLTLTPILTLAQTLEPTRVPLALE